MIIFNTTFCMDEAVVAECVRWLRETYIPQAIDNKLINSPRLAKIVSHESDTVNYSLQFEVVSIDALESWYRITGNELQQALIELFGERVLGFTTLMEVVE